MGGRQSAAEILARACHDPSLRGRPVRVEIVHRGAPDNRRTVTGSSADLELGARGFGLASERFIPYHRVLAIRCGWLTWNRQPPAEHEGSPSGPGLEPAWRARLEAQGVLLDEAAWLRLETYLELLERARRVDNLVSRRLDGSGLAQLVGESLLGLTLTGASVRRHLDVGSGAGIPGLVLAIALPGAHTTLIEPRAKRTGFLLSVRTRLGLRRVEVVRERLGERRLEGYGLVSVRGLSWRPLREQLLAALAPGGRLLCWEPLSSEPEAVPGWELSASRRLERHWLRRWQPTGQLEADARPGRTGKA